MSQCYTASPYLVDFEVGRSFRELQYQNRKKQLILAQLVIRHGRTVTGINGPAKQWNDSHCEQSLRSIQTSLHC
jgi:hypothetical protein